MVRSCLLALVLLSACTLEITTMPRHALEGLPAGLDARLTVEPDEVQQHASFTVLLTVTNTRTVPIQLVTAHGCLALPHVLLNGRRVPFEGTALGCTAAITTHTFAAGQSHVLQWELRAELYAEHREDPADRPAPKGDYRVRAEFETYSLSSPERPAVEAPLRVK
jgi:hypothetical protein